MFVHEPLRHALMVDGLVANSCGLARNPYVINIGAADGVKLEDPTAYFLTDPDATGLACEYDSVHTAALHANYPSKAVTKIFGPVTPDNVLKTFNDSRVPIEPFILKVGKVPLRGLLFVRTHSPCQNERSTPSFTSSFNFSQHLLRITLYGSLASSQRISFCGS